MMKIKTDKEFLDLLPKLAQANADLNELKKEVDSDKKTIKEYMLDTDIDQADNNGWTVTLSPTVKSTMNEVKLMEIIQDLIKNAKGSQKEVFENLIVMKPTINEQLLEDLLYEGKISDKQIAPAVVTTTTHTLRFKKSKKK